MSYTLYYSNWLIERECEILSVGLFLGFCHDGVVFNASSAVSDPFGATAAIPYCADWLIERECEVLSVRSFP